MMRLTCLSRKVCSHRGGHCQIGLAGARRADAQGDGILLDGLHIPLLAQGLGLDGLSFGGDAEHVLGQGADLVLVARPHQVDDVAHILFVDGFPLGREGEQTLDGLHAVHDGLCSHGPLSWESRLSTVPPAPARSA